MSWHCPDCGAEHVRQYDEPTRCEACLVVARGVEVWEYAAEARAEVERLKAALHKLDQTDAMIAADLLCPAYKTPHDYAVQCRHPYHYLWGESE